MLFDWAQELVLLSPLPLVVAANLAEARPFSAGWRLAGRLALLAAPLAALVVGATDLAGAFLAGAAQRQDYALAGTGFLVAALAALALTFEPAAGGAARLLPIDPRSSVHRLALSLSVLIVLAQVTTQLTTDVLAQQAASGSALSRVDLVAQELPFLLAAVIGVGVGIRRSPTAVLRRLGITRPAAWQVLGALAAAGAFFAFGTGVDRLSEVVTPDLAHKVQAATDRLFGQLADPGGILTIAIAAGVCEEVLFRGALQPRLGLIWVAVVFASVHTQYGLSLDAAAVVVLALGLGLVRRWANTTASMLCHVTYNALVGFGVGWIGVLPAVGLEVALLALAALTFVLAHHDQLRIGPLNRTWLGKRPPPP